ncbi:MAG TPA: ABC transporter ATP-binding protein [Bauldia sp.]|nr:ABC transporter ATP-binding protein [Bauldia sp.]HVZ13154.1 ABC transporter ATP-binding protein [Bauldia sp.]
MAQVSVRDLDVGFGSLKVLQKLNVTAEDGEFLVLLGPSGCGKSTLLNAIAGLLEINGGQIFIGGKNVTWEEPKDRGIGMVFQSYALYPRMTVEGNLTFGLKMARVAKDEIQRRVARAAGILQIQDLLKRRPSELSGGQRQRVAIGRALVRDVGVFLFDEPLSNLDAKLRTELRVEIKKLHQQLGSTMIYVTHDQIEALTLADRIAVMNGGIIQQLAPPKEIYRRPVNRFVAGFVGSPSMNFIEGKISKAAGNVGVKLNGGDTTVSLKGYEFSGMPDDGRPVALGVRPEQLTPTSTMNGAAYLPLRVSLIDPMGADSLLWGTVGSDMVSIRIGAEDHYKIGEGVNAGFDPALVSLFDAQSGERV